MTFNRNSYSTVSCSLLASRFRMYNFDNQLPSKVTQALILSLQQVLGIDTITNRVARSLKLSADRLFEEILIFNEPSFHAPVKFTVSHSTDRNPREAVFKISERFCFLLSPTGQVHMRQPTDSICRASFPAPGGGPLTFLVVFKDDLSSEIGTLVRKSGHNPSFLHLCLSLGFSLGSPLLIILHCRIYIFGQFAPRLAKMAGGVGASHGAASRALQRCQCTPPRIHD